MAATSDIKTANDLLAEMLENTRKMQVQLNAAKSSWSLISDRLKEHRKGIIGTLSDLTGFGPKVDRWLLKTDSYVKNLKSGSQLTGQAAQNIANLNIRPLERLSVAYLAFAMVMRRSMNDTNGAIREGNMLLTQRYAILEKGLKVQAATGASTKTLNSAMAALINYGMESTDQYQSSLDIVVKMNKALGISTDMGAELAFLYSKMGRSTSSIASDISRIVDQTALAADEAARFAKELGRAAIFLPKGSQSLDFQFLGKMEGYIKEQRGIQGELNKFAADIMSTQTGSMQGLFLGIQGQQVATERGQRMMVERLSQLVAPAKAMRDQGNLLGANMFLQQLSDMYTGGALSPATLLALSDAYDQNNRAQQSTLDIEKRWAAELKDTGQMFGTLKNSMLGLMKEGLIPLVKATNWALSSVLMPLVKWITELSKSSALLKVGMTSLAVIAGGTALLAVGRLTTAVVQLGIAATIAARQVQANALAQGSQMMLPGIGGAAKVGRWGQFTAMAGQGAFRSVGATGQLVGAGAVMGEGPAAMKALRFMTSGPAIAIIGSAIVGIMGGLALNKWLHRYFGADTDAIRKANTQYAESTLGRSSRSNAFNTQIMGMLKSGKSMSDIEAYIEHSQRVGANSGKSAEYALMIQQASAVARVYSERESARVQTTRDPSKAAVEQAEQARQQVQLIQEMVDSNTKIVVEESKANRLREKTQRVQEERLIEQKLKVYPSNLQPHVMVGY